MFTLLVLGLPFLMAFWIGWVWAKKLVLKGAIRANAYYGRAVGLGILVPIPVLLLHMVNLLQNYQPDRCGSWWLGATPETCTLGFYIVSRTLAAFIFLIGPLTVLSVSLVLAIFWNVKANHP